MGEIASLDVHIKDMQQELENMSWHEFIEAAWNE
jgi:hypothetical protein